MEDENTNLGGGAVKFGLIGLGLGVVAGVAAGMLLAPKSGKETRELIVVKAGQVKDGTVAKFKKTSDGTEEVVITKPKAKKTTAKK